MNISKIFLSCFSSLVLLSGCAVQSKNSFLVQPTEEDYKALRARDYCSRAGFILASAEFSINGGYSLNSVLTDPTFAKISNDLAERHALEDLAAGAYQSRTWRDSKYPLNMACAKEKPEMVDTSYKLLKKAVKEYLEK